jgi:hypothetical protein
MKFLSQQCQRGNWSPRREIRILGLIGRCSWQVEFERRVEAKSPLSTFKVAGTIRV